MLKSGDLSDKQLKKVLGLVAPLLVPHETIRYVGYCVNIRPMVSNYVITDRRLIGLEQSTGKVEFVLTPMDLASFSITTKFAGLHIVIATTSGSSITLKGVPLKDQDEAEAELASLFRPRPDVSIRDEPSPEAAQPTTAEIPARAHVAADQSLASPPRPTESSAPPPPPSPAATSNTRICGKAISASAQKAVDEMRLPDEEPWLVLNPAGFTGILVAFADRLAIIKTGGVTALMAGATFGGRESVFYFRDITGIEFNSGLMSGVLEVLTPSYQGSGNKDYWRGTTKSRNADSNDPFTLSNTLPLQKVEYEAWKSHINELRRRIAESKQAPGPAPSQQPSVAEQLERLAKLHADGLLDTDEFQAAKARILQG